MAALTFVRHGATTQNDSGVFMGRLDFPCRNDALESARMLGEELAAIDFTHYRTSPLLRCVTTSRAIRPDAHFCLDERLAERCLGSWSGQSKGALCKTHPYGFLPSGPLDPRFNPPQGETLQCLASRVFAFLQEIGGLPLNAHVLAVSHNGVLRMMRCLLEAIPVEIAYSFGEPHLQPCTIEVTPAVLRGSASRIATFARVSHVAY